MRTLELQGIRKVLVHGDFNNENLSISGFTELNHKGMYHKHKEGAAKRYIDKVFANFAEVAVLEAYPSCENREQNLEEDIGHKSILIRIGRVPRKVIEHKFVNQKKFKKGVREMKGDGIISELTIEDLCDPEMIGAVAQFITEQTTELKGKCEMTVRSAKKQADKKALN